MHRTNFISLVCPFKPIHVPSLIVASVSYILDMYEKVLLVFLPLATSAKKKKILKTPMEMRFDFLDLVQYVHIDLILLFLCLIPYFLRQLSRQNKAAQ